MVGGQNTTELTQLEAYNPAANTWASLAPLPDLGDGNAGRYFGSAGVIDGKLYVVGGWRRNPALPTSSLQVYDPGSNSWTSSGDRGQNRWWEI